MLPFTQSQPLDLQALQLIYQQGGYWVYKIPGSKEELPPHNPPSNPLQPCAVRPSPRAVKALRTKS